MDNPGVFVSFLTFHNKYEKLFCNTFLLKLMILHDVISIEMFLKLAYFLPRDERYHWFDSDEFDHIKSDHLIMFQMFLRKCEISLQVPQKEEYHWNE